MKIKKTMITNQAAIELKHENHGQFEYYKHLIVPREGNQCTVAIMEIPPLKTSFPYHYHIAVTEVFYIISGEGVVITPEGEHKVSGGDVIVFPPGAAGAHKILNTSQTEILRYIDFDTTAQADVIFYPDSQKVGMILNGRVGKDFFKENSAVDYYEGEK